MSGLFFSLFVGNNRFTYVTQVIATDKDSGRNGEITYSIISGNLHKGVKSFVIDPPYTGIVKTNIILDREIVDTWRLVVGIILYYIMSMFIALLHILLILRWKLTSNIW